MKVKVRRSRRIRDMNSKLKSRASRASLHLQVNHVHRFLRKGKYSDRVGAGAPIFLTAVFEYLVTEVFELARNAVCDDERTKLTPRDLRLAIRNDDELNRLVSKVTIVQDLNFDGSI